MAYTVLVVDDSQFFQHRLRAMIDEHPQLEVVGVATNGQEAIEMDASLKPDVISMDYEMPLLDGVSAVKAILATRKVPIVMFSSLTYEGAKITLDALEAGAVDFISKNFAEVSQNSSNLKRKLHSTLIAFAKQYRDARPVAVEPAPTSPVNISAQHNAPVFKHSSHQGVNEKVSKDGFKTEPSVQKAPVIEKPLGTVNVSPPSFCELVVIGASTGGPVAVHSVLDALPANFSLPIVIAQHMPPNFTRALAERLDRVCEISVREAVDGDFLKPGQALIVPGGLQLMFDPKEIGKIKLVAGDERVTYKPSVDIVFASAAKVFGKKTLGIILTGMGADGCDGAKLIKQVGGKLWSQDAASCVVYGMPKAVAEAGLSDYVLPPVDIGAALKRGA